MFIEANGWRKPIINKFNKQQRNISGLTLEVGHSPIVLVTSLKSIWQPLYKTNVNKTNGHEI